jgi:hypothetical protein
MTNNDVAFSDLRSFGVKIVFWLQPTQFVETNPMQWSLSQRPWHHSESIEVWLYRNYSCGCTTATAPLSRAEIP